MALWKSRTVPNLLGIIQKTNTLYNHPMNSRNKSLILPLLLLLVALLVADGVQAQRRRSRGNQVFRAYPAIGATASQMRGDELRGFKKWGISAGVGAMLSLSNDNMWQLSVEADFAQRGSQNKTHDPYRLLGFTMNYVDIPLTFHFTYPYGGITVGLGLVYSRLVQQPHGTMYYTPNYFIPDTSDMSFDKNDFSAALDFRFPIWRGLTVNFRFQHSLLPVKKNWGFTEYRSAAAGGVESWTNNCYNSSISMRLLYVFGDSKHTRHRYNKPSPNKKKKRR